VAGVALAALGAWLALGCDVQMQGRRFTGPGQASPQARTSAGPAADPTASPAPGPPANATASAALTPAASSSAAAGVARGATATLAPGTGSASLVSPGGTAALALPNGLNAVEVVSAARPAVVHISTSVVRLDQFRRQVPVEAGVGTGVIFDQRGYILTNSHVIQDPTRGGPSRSVRITLADDRSFDATVVDDDASNDLAILKIDAPDLRPARIGDSSRLQVGEPVVAIGHALALPGGPTVSTGVVSALGRSIQEPNGVTLPDLVQTDAAINPGNSGGPLLNRQAEVVGINTAGTTQAQGISFAVAINQAKPAMESVARTGRVIRPFLGVSIIGEITPAIARANRLPAERGIAVEVTPNSPAARAGMRDGDIVVAVDGQEVRSSPELLAAIRRHEPGDQIRLRVARQGGQVDLTATLDERSS
jgi:S1-C subfamily serine protease